MTSDDDSSARDHTSAELAGVAAAPRTPCTMQADLFAILTPPCGECQNLGEPINPGVHYCWGQMSWRGAAERVEGCTYREHACGRREAPTGTRADAIRDLLESERHSIDAKGRKWLRAELRDALASEAAREDASPPTQLRESLND